MASGDVYHAQIELLRQLAHSDDGTVAYGELTRGSWRSKADVDAAIADAIERGYVDPPARRAAEYALTEHGRQWWQMLCSR